MGAPVVLTCRACGQKNRVPAARFGDRPVCGRCKAPLVTGGVVVESSDADFRRVVLDAPLPALVDFWAPWCGPCKMMAPVLEQVAAETAGRALVVKVNVDANPATSSAFGVTGVPTLILFSGGREIDRRVGAVPAPVLLAMIEKAAPR